jgi:hypothetical protein
MILYMYADSGGLDLKKEKNCRKPIRQFSACLRACQGNIVLTPPFDG